MPKKKKGGSRGSSPEESDTVATETAKTEEMAAWETQASTQQQHQPDGEQERVFLQVQEMFKNKVDADVIFMVLSECDWKVDDALEKLFALSSENETHHQPQQSLSMSTVAQALNSINSEEAPQSASTAATNASSPIPINSNANPSGLRLDVHARLPTQAGEQPPTPDFLTMLSPKTPAGVSLDFPELFHGGHGCSAGRDSAMRSAMEALGAYANNPSIGILPRYNSSKPGYPGSNSFEQSLVTDQNFNANLGPIEAPDYNQQAMFGGAFSQQPTVSGISNFPPPSGPGGPVLFPSVEIGQNNTDFQANYSFTANNNSTTSKEAHDPEPPASQQGPLPDLPHIVYNSQGMPVRKGHRKKTLSLDPAEREALENLIEDVIIGGMDEGVIDDSASSDSDSCETIEKEKETSPKVSDTLSPEDQRKFLAGDGGQHERSKDGDALGKRGKQEKGKDGGKVYPAQLKVAVKHMKSLPPRFLRRLQTAQKQLEANAKKGDSPDGELKIDPMTMGALGPMGPMGTMGSMGWNGSGQTMPSPTDMRERDLRDKSRAKEEHMREKKKKIRNLLDDLDQYTDETTVIIEEKEREESGAHDQMVLAHTMSPTSPPMGHGTNVMSCADLEREMMHPLQQHAYQDGHQLTPAELAELTHKMSPMAQRMASLAAAASQPNVLSLAAIAQDSLGDYSMMGERSQFSVDAPEFVPKGFMPPVSFNQPPPPIIPHSGQLGPQSNVSVMSCMGQPLPSGITPEQLQAFQQQAFLQKPSSPFQPSVGRVSPHMANTMGRLSPQIVTSQPMNMPPPQLSPEQRACNSPLIMPPKVPPLPRPMNMPPPSGVVPYPSYSIPPPPAPFPPRLPTGYQQFPFRPPFLPPQQGFGQHPWPAPEADRYGNPLRGHRPPKDKRHGSPHLGGPRGGGPRGLQAPLPQRMPNTADVTPSMTPEMAKLRVESLLKEGRKVMVILRGPPGSGKSTIAREIQFEGVVLSTDEFFVKPNGQFQYDFTKIGDAHQWNQQRAKESCEVGRNPIVIDNTNSQAWEMKYYVALADEHMYHIEIMEPSTQWKYKPKELAKRNTHGVTLETIVRMLDRYERNITPASILATLPKRPNTAKAPVKIPTDDKADSAAEPPPTGKKTRKRKRKRKRQKKNAANKDEDDKNCSDSEAEKDPEKAENEQEKGETDLEKVPEEDPGSRPEDTQKVPEDVQNSQKGSQISKDLKDVQISEEVAIPEDLNEQENMKVPENTPVPQDGVQSSPEGKDVNVVVESSSNNEDSLEKNKAEDDSEQFEMEDVEIDSLVAIDQSAVVGSKEWRKSQRDPNVPRKISITLADLKEALLRELAECDGLAGDDSTSSSDDDSLPSEDAKPCSLLASTPSKKEPALECIPEVPVAVAGSPKMMQSWAVPSSTAIPIESKHKDDVWQLPNFVSTHEFCKPPSQPVRTTRNCATFTTTADIVTMQKIERGEHIYFPEGPTKMITSRSRVISEGVDTGDARDIPTGVVMVDTSTMTDEAQPSSGIDFLRSCFPTVSVDDLGEILTQCQGNVEWAVNILLDSGYEYNESSRQPCEEVVEETSAVQEESPRPLLSLFDLCLAQLSGDQDLESPAIFEEASRVSISRLKEIQEFRLPEKPSQNEQVKVVKSEGLEMTMTAAFGSQLMQMLGPVAAHTSADSMTPQDMTFQLDKQALQEIHRCWTEHSLKRMAKGEADQDAMLSADEALARRLQAEEDEAVHSPKRGCSPAKSLRAIMQEEQEMEASKAQFIDSQVKASGQHGALSTQLKFQQLTDMFPTLGRTLLEEVFQAHRYCLEDSVHALQLVHGPSQPVRTHLAASSREKDAPSDFWLNQPENEEAMTSDPTYSAFRSEAFMHYQLRDECFQKAQEAFRRGMAPVAAFYSQQGRLHTEKLRLANRQAAAAIFQHRGSRSSLSQSAPLPDSHHGAWQPQSQGSRSAASVNHGLSPEKQLPLHGNPSGDSPRHAQSE